MPKSTLLDSPALHFTICFYLQLENLIKTAFGALAVLFAVVGTAYLKSTAAAAGRMRLLVAVVAVTKAPM